MGEENLALTKKQMIDKIVIPNIPSQYLREFCLHHNEKDTLCELSHKLSDIIPENNDIRQRDKRRERNNNPSDTPRDNPRQNGQGK